MSNRHNGYRRLPLGLSLRIYILSRDDFTCIYCGDPATQIDHVIPMKQRGPNKRGNLVSSCSLCNAKKSGFLGEPWLTIAFRHLAQKGESLKWLDNFDG